MKYLGINQSFTIAICKALIAIIIYVLLVACDEPRREFGKVSCYHITEGGQKARVCFEQETNTDYHTAEEQEELNNLLAGI